MATLNVQNLLVEINKKIVQTSDNEELLMLSKAVSVLKTGAIFTVGTFANLPDASENVGKLYFVENDGILYFSVVSTYNNSEYWVPVTNGLQINPLFSWGCNSVGQLGDGTMIGKSSPGTIAGGGTNWCQISRGTGVGGVAIKTDGTLWTWGCNNHGALGNGTTLDRCSPGTVAGGGINWCQVSGGAPNTAALKTDGTLWTWGWNNAGRLGDGTTLNRCSPGTTWGSYTTWCQVSSGASHVASIKTDGTLWTWGYNGQGRLGDGTTLTRSSPGTTAGCGTNWCQVSGGSSHTGAIKTDGTLWTWGCNSVGQLGDGTTVSRSSPGTTWGSYTTWCQVSGGSDHTAAIKTDGTIWTWGSNAQGRLGAGTTVSRCSPGTVAGGGTNWCRVSGASFNTAAIKTDGTLWTWGSNFTGGPGMLGDGTTVDRCSPGTIAGGGTNWCQVSFGSFHTAAIQRETL